MRRIADIQKRLRFEISKTIVGQDEVVTQLLVSLFSGGHVLLEGVPGTAKTLLARTLARVLNARFSRIQFTPDLMPSDILGTSVFNLETRSFTFTKGPIFTDILLADEINRTPPKTQAALLEAMEERQSTVDGRVYPHSEIFFVIATQNPIEFEGTYPLPEAQLDRFLMKIILGYPDRAQEREILARHERVEDIFDMEKMGVQPILDPPALRSLREELRAVRIAPSVVDYILDITRMTRESPSVALGASPRAAVFLQKASKTVAGFAGRDFVTPDDVKSIAHPILRPRLILKPEAEVEHLQVDDVISGVLASVKVPR